MAHFKSIKVDGISYPAPGIGIELLPANVALLTTFLNGLGFGTYSPVIDANNVIIDIIQSPYVHNSFTINNAGGDVEIPFTATQCISLETDETLFCDYTLQSDSDPSDVVTQIVINSTPFDAPSPFSASDVTAINAWLNSLGQGTINYQYNSGFYVVSLLTNNNISYIKILRTGDTVLYLNFTESNCRVPIYGCMNPLADNYNPNATIAQNDTCIYGTKRYGCTDPEALNYDPTAEILDDSCIYGVSELAALKCCAGEMAYNISQKRLNGDKVDCCSEKKLSFVLRAIFIIENYVPDSENYTTETTPGYVATALIPLDGLTYDSIVVGIIIVDGEIIGVIPETNVTSIDEFAALIIASIASFGGPYGAVDSDGTITLSAASSSQGVEGSVVEIIINPEFGIISGYLTNDRRVTQLITVNDPDSAFYGKSYLGTRQGANYLITEIDNQVTTQEILVPQQDPNNSFTQPGSNALIHDEANDRIYMSGFVPKGKFNWMNSDYTFTSPIATLFPSLIPMTTILGSGRGIYNPFNKCKYFNGTTTAYPIGNLYKIDEFNVITTIELGTGAITAPRPSEMAIDPVNGNIWIQGYEYVFVVDPTTNAVLQRISFVGLLLSDIVYVPTSAGGPCMLVSAKNPGVIKRIELDYTIGVDFYTFAGTSAELGIHYSTLFNCLFVGTGVSVTVISMLSAVIKKDIAANSINFNDINKTGLVIGSGGSIGPDRYNIYHFGLTNEGEFNFPATLEGEVPPVTTVIQIRPDDNCITQTKVDAAKYKSQQLCANCCDSPEKQVNDVIPPN